MECEYAPGSLVCLNDCSPQSSVPCTCFEMGPRMRIRQVELPSAVLDAQRNARLVIFAGAGVSVDSPSNYPDFDELAARVGGKQRSRQPDEAIDRYLGRLVEAGVTVHQQVRSILTSPESRPNGLHSSLL